MNRREFVRLAGAGAPAAVLAEAVVSAQSGPVTRHLRHRGTDNVTTSEDEGRHAARRLRGDFPAVLDAARRASHTAGANESARVATTIIQSPLGVS